MHNAKATAIMVEDRNAKEVRHLDEQQFKALVARAAAAARAYYNGDAMLMPDSEYDNLVETIAAAKAEHPDWDDQGATSAVAAGVGTGDVRHPTPMLSLAKVKTVAEVEAFLAAVGGKDSDYDIEPKMDGLAIRAAYAGGALQQVVTRGDGFAGEDVTVQAQGIQGLPQHLAQPFDLEVRGEVFMTDRDFERANESRVASGKPAFVNPRNATAGALRAKDRTYDAPMSFACYDALYAGQSDSYRQRLAYARAAGVTVVSDLVSELPSSPLAAIAEIGRLRPSLGYPIDGVVLKLDADEKRQALGATSHSPRWACAYKFPADTATTTLLGIEPAIGRTGRLSLTAILLPVYVGGAVVSRATLHHPEFIRVHDLRIGDRVFVYRSGDVIPRVTAPDLRARPEGLAPWQPPETCPQCGEPLQRQGLTWRCITPECSVVGRIRYFASRDVMDVDGLDEATAEALVEAGLVSDIADLYDLTQEQLANLPLGTTATGQARLLGQKTAERILTSLREQTKAQPLARVITALGIRATGRTMGRRLAARFRTLDALRAATLEELASVEGVGDVKAATIRAGLTEMAPVIDRLVAAGVATAIEEAPAAAGPLPLAGRKVCVTGTVPGLTRSEADAATLALGGEAVGSVSRKTDLVVVGEGAGSKADKARQLGVPIMDAAEFAALFRSLR